MKRFLSGALLAGMILAGSHAFAQTIPNVQGLTPFSPQAKYMSLPGYLRWQYYMQNDGVWISIEEAQELVRSQLAGE